MTKQGKNRDAQNRAETQEMPEKHGKTLLRQVAEVVLFALVIAFGAFLVDTARTSKPDFTPQHSDGLL